MSPDARHARRELPQFLSVLRAHGHPSEALGEAAAAFVALADDVAAQAPGPILLALLQVAGNVHLSSEDLGPPRCTSSANAALLTARTALGTRVDVDLGPSPAAWTQNSHATAAAYAHFERWELARWIDLHAPALVEQALAATSTSMGAFGGGSEIAAQQLTVTFRHLGSAIALDEIDLFLNEVRWLLASGGARSFDIDGILDILRSALALVQKQIPAHAMLLLGPILARLRDIAPAATEGSHLRSPLAERYFAAFDFGASAVETFLKEALSLGISRRAVFLDMLQQAQRETGRRWQIGEFTVGEEQLRTATAMRLMTALRAHAPKIVRHGVLFGACAPGEAHQIGLHMVCDLAAIDGWNIVMGAPGIFPDALVDAIEAANPDVLALSATLSMHVAGLIGLIAEVRRRPNLARCAIIVGGAPFIAFPHLCALVGADAFALDAADAVEVFRSHSRGAPGIVQSTRATTERRS